MQLQSVNLFSYEYEWTEWICSTYCLPFTVCWRGNLVSFLIAAFTEQFLLCSWAGLRIHCTLNHDAICDQLYCYVLRLDEQFINISPDLLHFWSPSQQVSMPFIFRMSLKWPILVLMETQNLKSVNQLFILCTFLCFLLQMSPCTDNWLNMLIQFSGCWLSYDW